MIRLFSLVALVALAGAPEALACRVLAKGGAKAQMEQAKREWDAQLAGTRKVSGTYSIERQVPNSAQREAMDEFGAIVGPDARVRARTFLEQANMIVISCGPIAIKPRPGQSGTFYLRKRDSDDRFVIVHFEKDELEND